MSHGQRWNECIQRLAALFIAGQYHQSTRTDFMLLSPLSTIAVCKSNLVFSFHSTSDLSDSVLYHRSRQLSVAFHSNSVSFISREAAAAIFTNWSSLKIMNQAYLMWLTACMGTKLKYYPLFFTKIMPRPHPTILLSKHQRWYSIVMWY